MGLVALALMREAAWAGRAVGSWVDETGSSIEKAGDEKRQGREAAKRFAGARQPDVRSRCWRRPPISRATVRSTSAIFSAE